MIEIGWRFTFSLFYKRKMIFETIFWIARTQNQVPDRAFQRVQRVITGSERVSAKEQAS